MSLVVIVRRVQQVRHGAEAHPSGPRGRETASASRVPACSPAPCCSASPTCASAGFRTALTRITIVLITFAVLCFTSAERISTRRRCPPANRATATRGMMLRQRGYRPIPPDVADRKPPPLGRGQSRSSSAGGTSERPMPKRSMHGLSQTGDRRARPLLGLSPRESEISSASPVSAKTSWLVSKPASATSSICRTASRSNWT